MNRKLVLVMTLTLLVGVLNVAFNIQPVESDYTWTETIYIRADGSVYPDTAPISSADNVTYTLTDNIVGNVPSSSSTIIIERDNIVVDGAGFTVQGTGASFSKGIDLTGRSNVTITNIQIREFDYGVYLYFSSGNSVSGNNITANRKGISLGASSNNSICENNVTNNGRCGIYLYQSSNNTISGNSIIANGVDGGVVLDGSRCNIISANNITNNGGWGIELARWAGYSDNNTISGNNVANNNNGIMLSASWYNTIIANNVTNNKGSYGGIHMDTCSQNILRNNNLAGNKYNFGVYTSLTSVPLSSFIQDIDTSNTVNGKPIYYLINQKDLIIDSIDIGYLALINCTNIHIKKVALANNCQGLLLAFVTNSTVENATITHNRMGIYLLSSYENTICANTISDNLREGIILYRASFNNITRNTLTHSGYSLGGGIVIGILETGYLSISRPGEAIQSEDNIINNNMISNCGNGIVLSNAGTTRTTVTYNTIRDNEDTGITVEFNASNNKIYHNNFIDNKKQAYIDVSRGIALNAWDNGYPSGGNYWSNYTGVDADNDGIGDEPHTIDANNTDRYPLMAPINIFDAGVWDGTAYNVDVVSNSTVSEFQFNPSEGALLRFNVTGDDGTSGFCRVTIPKSLLWVEDGWTVYVGEESVNYTIIPDNDYAYLYFTYNHSTKTVLIQGTHVIPEFPSTITLSLFMILSIIAVVFANKKRKNKA